MSEDIHSLLSRYFNRQVTEEEEQTVRQWISENDQNASEFNLLQQLWNSSGEQPAVQFDTQKAWQQVDSKLRADVKKPATIRPIFRIASGIAASVALIVAILWFTTNRTKIKTVFAQETVQKILLADGSAIYLRKGSTISYPEKFDSKRLVTLQGTAFFDVARDPSKPFIITADKTSIEVVGTSFSVNTGENQVELIVKTGRVNFSAMNYPDQKILVLAGEKAMFANNEITKKTNEDQNFNAWQSGQLVFENTPLKDVAVALSRFYKVNIAFREKDSAILSAATVTNIFSNQGLADALEDLALITSFRIQRISDTYYEISIK